MDGEEERTKADSKDQALSAISYQEVSTEGREGERKERDRDGQKERDRGRRVGEWEGGNTSFL